MRPSNHRERSVERSGREKKPPADEILEPTSSMAERRGIQTARDASIRDA